MNKDTKGKIFDLLGYLANETSPSRGKGYVDQIKKLFNELPRAAYEKKEKLDCHAALEFLEVARKSFAALAGDLRETSGRLDKEDSRQPVFRSLRAMMERLAGEMQEAHQTINRINRF